MNIEKYTLPIITFDIKKLLESWLWLTGNDKKIYLITKAGDLLLEDLAGKKYFLNTGYGELSLLANTTHELEEKFRTKESFDEIFMPALITKFEFSGKILKNNQVYSYVLLPLLGGTYDPENVYCLDIYEHFSLTGEINYKLKDKPDGTSVTIKE